MNKKRVVEIIHHPKHGLMQRKQNQRMFVKCKQKRFSVFERHFWICRDYRDIDQLRFKV